MQQEETQRVFTWRSLLFSILGVLLIAGTAGFHDERMFGSTLVVGNHLPVAAFAYVFLIGLGWNALAMRIRRSLALNTRELTVVMIVCLVSCFAPTSGLFRYFHRGIIMPWYYMSTGGRPEWEKFGLLTELLKPSLFPQPLPYYDSAGVLQLDETVYRGFFTGLSSGSSLVGLGRIPFRAWLLPMMYWGPLVLLCAFFCAALAFLVHRQWSLHEQLSYPIAQVAFGFCERRDGRRGIPDIFTNRLFWFGFVPLFSLYMIEYVARWYPDSFPGLREMLPAFRGWWVPLNRKIPIITKGPIWWALCGQTIYFCVVGLAYFVSSEISLSMGLSTLLLVVSGVWYYQITGTPMTGDQLSLMRGGAYFGYALVLLYTGRNYYSAILFKALGLGRLTRGRGRLTPQSGTIADDRMGVLAARVLLASTAGFVAVLVAMGSSFIMALCYALLLLLLFLVLTRIVCETGIPFIAAEWWPGRMLISLFGPTFIGPGTMVLLLWVTNALCIDPRECLMPYVATGTRLAESARLPLRRIFGMVLLVIVAAVAVAFVAQHWTLYNLGPMADSTAATRFPQMHFQDAAKAMGEMAERGTLTASCETRGLARLALLESEPGAWSWLLTAAAIVLLMSLLRFRFARFPLHPVLLMVWGTYPCYVVWASFMLGWFVKTLIVKFGGGAVYQRFKPFFIGLIASELMASAFVIMVDMLYFWLHGEVARVQISILPV